MPRMIEGTVRFDVYLYRAKAVRRRTSPVPNDFVYRQWGRVVLRDESGRAIKNIAITDFGDMIHFMNQIMRKRIMKDLKQRGVWKR
jgi:ribosomal 50S subunit-recycling heat shock protein